MALFTPDQGLVQKLGLIRNAGNFPVELYQNDYTPVAGSIRSNFTIASFGGYAGVAAGFGAVAINAGGQAQMTSNLLTYTKTSGSAQTVYGYFVTDNASTMVYFCERFGTPIAMNLNGDTIRLQIVDQMGRA